jgi:hypothetical protein
VKGENGTRYTQEKGNNNKRAKAKAANKQITGKSRGSNSEFLGGADYGSFHAGKLTTVLGVITNEQKMNGKKEKNFSVPAIWVCQSVTCQQL